MNLCDIKDEKLKTILTNLHRQLTKHFPDYHHAHIKIWLKYWGLVGEIADGQGIKKT